MKKLLTGALTLMLTASVSAQTKLWTLQECIDYAMQHNITLQRAKLQQLSAKEDVSQSKAALLPSLNASTSHNFGYRPWQDSGITTVTNGTVNTKVDKASYNGSYGLNASWTVWNGNRNRNQVKLNRLTEEQAELEIQETANSIQEKIAQLYVQIMYTKEAKRVNELLLSTAQSQYDRGVEMMNQGQMARADVVQLEAQLSSAQYSVVNTETQLANYKRQLKALLELDLNTPFDVSGNIPTDEQVLALVPSAQEAYAKALETRPEIKSAELSIEAADMQLDIAKRGFYPTIGASASLGSNHSTGSNNGWGEQMKTNLNMSAGLNFSVPIFDNRRNMSNVKTAKLQQLSSKLDLQDKKNTLSSTIEQYWLNANSGQQNYIAAKSRVKSQEASYELLNEQFQNGLKNTVDVLQGRDNVISAEQDMLQSKYMALLNIQLLKFYTGEKIEL